MDEVQGEEQGALEEQNKEMPQQEEINTDINIQQKEKNINWTNYKKN